MSGSRRRSKNRKPGVDVAPAPPAFWTSPAELPEIGRIRPADDPSATLRSLGPPPLPGQPAAVESLVLVAAKAAGVATALAAAADILDMDGPA